VRAGALDQAKLSAHVLDCTRATEASLAPLELTVLMPVAMHAGAVDRAKLSAHVLGEGNESNLARLEAAVHPLVEAKRNDFLQQVRHLPRLCTTCPYNIQDGSKLGLYFLCDSCP
jgi:dephospho-CoA kinase